MNILIQPCSNGEAIKNFFHSIIYGIPLSSFEGKINNVIFEKLKSQNTDTINVWGILPLDKNILQWNQLSEGDYVLFYENFRFFCLGEVYAKIQNREVAQSIWPVNKKNREIYEYMYFLKEDCYKINTPYDPDVIHLEKHFCQEVKFLDDQRSLLMKNYINEQLESDIIIYK